MNKKFPFDLTDRQFKVALGLLTALFVILSFLHYFSQRELLIEDMKFRPFKSLFAVLFDQHGIVYDLLKNIGFKTASTELPSICNP